MNSTEKVKLTLDRVENFAGDPEAPTAVQAAAAMVAMGRGSIEQFFPDTSEELDDLLERGAEWMLSLRSDPER